MSMVNALIQFNENCCFRCITIAKTANWDSRSRYKTLNIKLQIKQLFDLQKISLYRQEDKKYVVYVAGAAHARHSTEGLHKAITR
jgi:hypothetical protein